MTHQYQTIVADPPWQVAAGRSIGKYVRAADGSQPFGVTDNAARKLAYPSLTVQQISELFFPVAQNAHLYLWTINAYLKDAYEVARLWGFKPSTMLVWAKKPMGGGLGGCYGLATEYCLFARRGTLKATARVGRNWFDWKRPYKDGYPHHSAKPPEFYSMVETVSPGPRLELFARQERPGWNTWGNEKSGCACGGSWRIDGAHSNEFCSNCFRSKPSICCPPSANLKEES